MEIIKDIKKMNQVAQNLRKQDTKIGFVPTMGYLHEGHMSLIKKAREECDFLVVSIFVNPIQFGPREDFKKYPRDLNRDLKIAKKEKVDIIFNPSKDEMYSANFSTYVEEKKLSSGLCGVSRPGHFRGVTTIVVKLFNIVIPDIAYFGQKDIQQALIIKRMVQDLNMSMEIKILPIIREDDGLALSSRNKYLTPQQRKEATILYESLKEAESMIKRGITEVDKITQLVRNKIDKKELANIDYVEVVNLRDLKKIERIQDKALLAIAVYFGDTRLIDNVILNAMER